MGIKRLEDITETILSRQAIGSPCRVRGYKTNGLFPPVFNNPPGILLHQYMTLSVTGFSKSVKEISEGQGARFTLYQLQTYVGTL